MALVIADRVKETSVTTGTGAFTLLGAQTGYRAFSSVLANGDTTYYCIANAGSGEWEVGIGTYASSGNTLTRTTVLSSSNAGSAVNFGSGTKDVFLTQPAGKSIYADGSGLVSVPPSAAPVGGARMTVVGGISGAFTFASVQSTSSGTVKDFPAPSWARGGIVILNNVSLTGGDDLLVQLLSAAGTAITSGYASSASNTGGNSSGTGGFKITRNSGSGSSWLGNIIIATLDGLMYSSSGIVSDGSGTHYSAGGISVSSAIYGFRLTNNGTSSFDNGNVTVAWFG